MMNSSKNAIDLSGPPLVVGTVHSPGSLAAARRIRAGEIDLLELRVDAFGKDPEPLLRIAPKLRVPLIVTVRHASEGGALPLSASKRRELFAKFLPCAAAIDVELRFAREMKLVLDLAREKNVRVILSHHDFAKTPSVAKLRQLAQHAFREKADIFKVAATATCSRDVATLLDFLTAKNRLPLSVMGMGAFGKISRLTFASCGSVLNYGFLDTANASGQWQAKLLKKRIAEVLASAIQQQPPQKNR